MLQREFALDVQGPRRIRYEEPDIADNKGSGRVIWAWPMQAGVYMQQGYDDSKPSKTAEVLNMTPPDRSAPLWRVYQHAKANNCIEDFKSKFLIDNVLGVIMDNSLIVKDLT